MNLNLRTISSAMLLAAFLSGSGFCHPVRGEDDSSDEKKNEQEYPERMKDRSAVEWIVATPGLLINLPMKLLFKGIGGTAGWVDESRLTDRVDNFLTSADGTKGVRPVYSSRGGAGLKFFHKNVLSEGSKLEISAAAGLRLRQKYQCAVKRLFFWDDNLFAGFDAGYQMQPDERFFGVGPATSLDEETNFTHEHTSVLAELGARLGHEFDLIVSLGFDNNTILAGKNDDVQSLTDNSAYIGLPGLEAGVKLIHAGLALAFDSRKTPAQTANGLEADIYGAFYDQPDGDNYAFWRLSADLKFYLHLFYGRGLVLRVAGETTEPFSGASIPFYSLSELGRQETIRGFSRGRFRDLDMVLGSMEYHYPIWQHHEDRLVSFIFVDAGQVLNDRSRDLNWDDAQISFGGGFSFATEEGETFRVLIGKSKEQYRFYVVLN